MVIRPAPRVTKEWRVVWKRVGCRRKFKRFGSRATAEKFLTLFGPEPWRHSLRPGQSGDSLMCCPGQECACQGLTYRQASDDQRARQPGLEYVRLESRPKTAWSDEPSERIAEAILSDFVGATS